MKKAHWLALFLALALLPVFTPSARGATYMVTKTNDSGPGSLRQAIIDANNNPGPDTIAFNIPKSDPGYVLPDMVWFIWPNSLLPCLSGGGTTIDGTTQTTNQGDTNPEGPEVLIHGGNLGGTMNIFCVESNANTIMGLTIAYGPGAGISIITGASANEIKYNYIGTTPDGDWSWPNETGVVISSGAHDNDIVPNLISGNSHYGIVVTGSSTCHNDISRNYIGLDREGKSAVPNGWDGIAIFNGAWGNCVGCDPAYPNFIGGNLRHGVYITDSGTANNTVAYNHIGIDTTGTGAVGNGYSGVALDGGARSNWITFNLISGNHQHGVFISGSGTRGNELMSNVIGANAQVTGLVPNHNHGVAIYDGADENTIGRQVGTENVIVGNGWSGVAIVNSDKTTVVHNFIGTDATGLATNLGNAFYGVHVVNGSNNTIERNHIAYNGTHTTSAGVRVEGASATFNTITQSSIHDNSGKGIELANGGNAGLVTPSINKASCQGPVEGSACAGCTVEVFSDDADEGRIYEGSTTAHAIQPAFSWSGTVHGPNVTVTATDSQGNTSEFSVPFNVGICGRIFLPMVLKHYQ